METTNHPRTTKWTVPENPQASNQTSSQPDANNPMSSNEVRTEKTVDTSITFTKISEYIMSFPSKTKLVHIYDTTLTRGDLECLLQDGRWLHGDVINAYIYCLRVQEHLCYRAGVRVFLDNTYVFGILKRDGELSISPENHPHIVERALNYLRHDMLKGLEKHLRVCLFGLQLEELELEQLGQESAVAASSG